MFGTEFSSSWIRGNHLEPLVILETPTGLQDELWGAHICTDYLLKRDGITKHRTLTWRRVGNLASFKFKQVNLGFSVHFYAGNVINTSNLTDTTSTNFVLCVCGFFMLCTMAINYVFIVDSFSFLSLLLCFGPVVNSLCQAPQGGSLAASWCSFCVHLL